MPRKRRPPDDPRAWLNRAASNLACAEAVVPDAYYEDLCFDAQQAAEKAIKAVFMCHGMRFPFVHELGRLLTSLRAGGVKVPKYVLEAGRLTRYAIETRYPGMTPPVTKRQYRAAVRIAAAVFE